MVLKMVIKMADINGPAKSWKLHEFWTERITEEFFRQVKNNNRNNHKCARSLMVCIVA